ncbi:hypothetical protein P9112_005841 [Eukaryota sp. TZLM1-RC]
MVSCTRSACFILLLLLLTLVGGSDVYLKESLNPDELLTWSSNNIWKPFPPSSESIVYLSGGFSIIVFDEVTIHSLHLDNVTMVVDCSFTILGSTVLKGAVIQSLTKSPEFFTSTNLTLLGTSLLKSLNLSVLHSAELIEGDLNLDNSQLLIAREAVLAVKPIFSLVAWGDGDSGKTGTGIVGVHGMLPIKTEEELTGIAAGQIHSLGFTSEGDVFIWGNNNFNLLGLGRFGHVFTPTKVPDISDVVQVSAGAYFSLARGKYGDVYSWGRGADGRLGHGDDRDQRSPKKIDSLSNVIDISAGRVHGLALLESGEVKVWGYNFFGQLGLGEGSADRVYSPVSNGLSSIRKVLGCHDYSLVIDEFDRLRAAGLNNDGQLCIGNNNDHFTFEYIHSYDTYAVVHASCSVFTIFSTNENAFVCGSVNRGYQIRFDIKNVVKVFAGNDVAYFLTFDGLLFKYDFVDTILTPIDSLLADDLSAGDVHFLGNLSISPSIISNDGNSIVKVDGVFETHFSGIFILNVPLIITSGGKLQSFSGGIYFQKLVENLGSILTFSSLKVSFFANLDLIGGIVYAESPIVLHKTAVLQGFGLINGNFQQYGALLLTGDMDFIQNLEVFDNSIIKFESFSEPPPSLFVKGKAILHYVDIQSEDLVGNFTAVDLDLIGDVYLSSIWLSIVGNGKLLSGNLHLTNSKVIIEDSGSVSVDSILNPVLMAWGDGGNGKTGTGTFVNHEPLPVITEMEFDTLAVGFDHTLALNAHRQLYTWGANSFGQLGVGYSSPSGGINWINTFYQIEQISAGNQFSLARTTLGHVLSWGSGSFGKLGHGSKDDLHEPTIVALSADPSAIDISAGDSHSLVVEAPASAGDSNILWSWGHAATGALGGGYIGVYRSTPGKFYGQFYKQSVKKVIGCPFFSLFITEEDQLFASGSNDQGQLCVGDTNNRFSPTAINSVSSFNVVSAACGSGYTIFVNDFGEVFSCGRVLGRSINNPTEAYSPGKVTGFGNNVDSIGGGLDEAFVLLSNGVLFRFSQFSDLIPFKGSVLTSIYCGFYHGFGHSHSLPSISAYGDDSSVRVDGILENHSLGTISITPPLFVDQNAQVSAVNGGIKFDGIVQNSGIINSFENVELIFTFVLNLEAGHVISYSPILNYFGVVFSGSGLIDADILHYGELYSTGYMEMSKDVISFDYSIIKFESFSEPPPSLFVKGKAILHYVDIQSEDLVGNFTAVDLDLIGDVYLSSIWLSIVGNGKLLSGNLHLTNSKVIIEDSGSVSVDSILNPVLMAWGDGGNGKTGTGTFVNHEPLPVIVDEVFDSIVGADFHSLGLTSEGFVFSWGSGSNGQLGFGDYQPRFFPTQIPSLQNVVQISAGILFSLARTAEGDVYSWGFGLFGRLGHGDSEPRLSPTKIDSLSGVNYISAGDSHAISIVYDGIVYSWGYNHYGQLGFESDSSEEDTPRVASFDTTPVKKVIGCPFFSLFITEEDQLFASGSNDQGQLCVGDTNNRFSPTPINSVSSFNVVSAACGSGYTIFVNDVGEVFSCGRVLGRSIYNPTEAYSPGKVTGFGNNVDSIGGGLDEAFVLLSNGVLFRFTEFSGVSSFDVPPVGQIFTGDSFLFGIFLNMPSFHGDQASLLQVSGSLQGLASSTFSFHVAVDVSGILLSASHDLMFHENLIISGSVDCITDCKINLFRQCSLVGGEIAATQVVINSYSRVLGFGFINSDVINNGIIEPTEVIEIANTLTLPHTSIVILNNKYGNDAQLLVGGTLFLDGLLVVDFSHQLLSKGSVFALLLFSNSVGDFNSVDLSCSSYFLFNLGEDLLELTVSEDIVSDLNQISFISPYGANDDCCGTFLLPCLSLSRIQSRMGSRGTVHFFEGRYSELNFDVPLNAVDYRLEPINSGNEFQFTSPIKTQMSFVIFDQFNIHFEETEFLHTTSSVVELDNVVFTGHVTDFIISVRSTIRIYGINSFVESPNTALFDLDLSTLLLNNALFINNSSSVIAIESTLDLSNVVFQDQLIQHYIINIESSHLDMFNVSFSDIVTTGFDSDFTKLLSAKTSDLTLNLVTLDGVFGGFFDSIDSKWDLDSVQITNSEALTFINSFFSNIELKNVQFNYSFGQLLIASDNSTVSSLYLVVENLNVYDSVFQIFGSSFKSEFLSISTSVISSLLFSENSLIEWFNANITDIYLSNGNLFDFNSSTIVLSKVIMLGRSFDTIPNVFDGFVYASVIHAKYSTLSINESNFIGFLINEKLLTELKMEHSNVYFFNSSSPLALTNLSISNSTISFYTGYPVLIRSFISDLDSYIIGSDKYLNLDYLEEALALRKVCYSTKSTLLEFSFPFAELINYLVTIDVFHSVNVEFSLAANMFHLTLHDLFAYSIQTNFIKILYSSPIIQFYLDTKLPLCEPSVSMISPPTRGGLFGLNGENLGHRSLLIQSDTLDLRVIGVPVNHDSVILEIPPSSGCHYLKLRRSVDNSTITDILCFQPPVIHSIFPNPYQLQKEMNIKGENFVINPDLFELTMGNLLFNYSIIYLDFDEVFLEITQICDLNLGSVIANISISNQISNNYDLELKFPDLTIDPRFLSPLDNHLLLHVNGAIDLKILMECSLLDFYTNLPMNWELIGSNVFNITFEANGLDSFQFIFQISNNFRHFIQVPIYAFSALPPTFPCLKDKLCIITICLKYDNTIITDFEPRGNNFILVKHYHYIDQECLELELISSQDGNINDLKMCNKLLCNSIDSLPIIANINSVAPPIFQWPFKAFTSSIVCSGSFLDSFDQHTWKSSLLMDGMAVSPVISSGNLTLPVYFDKISNATLEFCGFEGCFVLAIIQCNDFVVVSPIFFPFSTLIIYSRFSYSSLELFVGNSPVPISAGDNLIQLTNQPVIVLDNIIRSNLVQFNSLPDFIGLNVPFQIVVDLTHSDFDVSISSDSHCFSNFSYIGTELSINILGEEIEFCVLKLNLNYNESILSKDLVFNIVDDPKIEFLGPNYFSFTEQVSFSVSFKASFNCFSDHAFFANSTLLVPTITSNLDESDDQCIQQFHFSFNFGEFDLKNPINYIEFSWTSMFFSPQSVEMLEIFNLEFFSDSTVSLFEPRDVTVMVNTILNPPISGILEGIKYFAFIDGSSLLFNNLTINHYRESFNLSLFYIDLEIGYVEVTAEPFFVDNCYVEYNPMLLDISAVKMDNKFKSYLFDKSRCCLVASGECFVEYFSGDTFNIEFSEDYFITSITISTNSSCLGSLSKSPLTIRDVPAGSWSCESLLNGFDYAAVCSISIKLNGVPDVQFDVVEDLLLFEIELYGYKGSQCLSPIDDFLGETPYGDFVGINGTYEFQGTQFSKFESIYSIIQPSLQKQTIGSLLPVTFYFKSDNCYYQSALFSRDIEVLVPKYIELENDQIFKNSNSFTINCNCFDLNGFSVHCFTSEVGISVERSSFEYKSLHLMNPNSIKFTFSSSPVIGNHSLELVSNGEFFTINFTFVQSRTTYLITQLVGSAPCHRKNLLTSSCSVVVFQVDLIIQDFFHNISNSLSLYELEISSFSVFTVLNATYMEVEGLPLSNVEFSFQYQDFVANSIITLDDCDPTRINLNNECHCKPGTVPGSVGECEPCPLGYYLDNPLLGECINCPYDMTTNLVGSVNITDCVCPKEKFNNGNTCINCPKYSNCEYGELKTVLNGYKFTLETGSISCPYRYSCRNNQCRFNTKGIDCTECIEGTKRFGFICLGSRPLFVAILVTIVLLISLFFSEYYLNFCINRFNSVLESFSIASLSGNIAYALAKSRGTSICPLRALMVVSILLNDNIVLITVPFSLSASFFGQSFGFVLLIGLIFGLFLICKYYFSHQNSYGRSYYSSICSISALTGILGKILERSIDFELFFLIGVLLINFWTISATKIKTEEFQTLVVIFFLLSITYLPLSLYLGFQIVSFLILFFSSGWYNASLSIFVILFCIIKLMIHNLG